MPALPAERKAHKPEKTTTRRIKFTVWEAEPHRDAWFGLQISVSDLNGKIHGGEVSRRVTGADLEK
jgi:hypothetical protein